MKLPRTDVVFSKTTMVLFLCRNKSSRNETKLCEEFLWNKRGFLEPRPTGEGPLGGHNPPGHAPLSWRAQVGCTHLVAPLMTPLILSHYSRKESGRKNYRVSRDRAAAKPSSSLGGQIWSPFGAPERGIFDLCHH